LADFYSNIEFGCHHWSDAFKPKFVDLDSAQVSYALANMLFLGNGLEITDPPQLEKDHRDTLEEMYPSIVTHWIKLT
jgi:hypothetical protein